MGSKVIVHGVLFSDIHKFTYYGCTRMGIAEGIAKHTGLPLNNSVLNFAGRMIAWGLEHGYIERIRLPRGRYYKPMRKEG